MIVADDPMPVSVDPVFQLHHEFCHGTVFRRERRAKLYAVGQPVRRRHHFVVSLPGSCPGIGVPAGWHSPESTFMTSPEDSNLAER